MIDKIVAVSRLNNISLHHNGGYGDCNLYTIIDRLDRFEPMYITLSLKAIALFHTLCEQYNEIPE